MPSLLFILLYLFDAKFVNSVSGKLPQTMRISAIVRGSLAVLRLTSHRRTPRAPR